VIESSLRTLYFALPHSSAIRCVTLSVKSCSATAPSSTAFLKKLVCILLQLPLLTTLGSERTLSVRPVAQIINPLNGLGQGSRIFESPSSSSPSESSAQAVEMALNASRALDFAVASASAGRSLTFGTYIEQKFQLLPSKRKRAMEKTSLAGLVSAAERHRVACRE
jgi:hypothetical protein